MRALVFSVFLAATALAGCISSDDVDTTPADDAVGNFLGEVSLERVAEATEDLSNVIDPDHGGAPWLHAVPELHSGSHGMELVGYNPLTRASGGEDPLGSDSGYGALDTWRNLVCVTHFAGSTGIMGGATIVDIEDPTNPVVRSSVISGAANSDCQFTDDGRFLLLAGYAGASVLPHVGPAPIRDLASNGVSVYDVTDPSDPQFLFHDTQGAGPVCTTCSYHNVFTAKIGDSNYVFQTYTGLILKINEDATALETVSEIEHSSHDLWVGQHPITGDWMIVTGTAGDGTAVFNINDPENPALLGVWEADIDNRYVGWHRQWPVDGTIDGRAYMVVAGEECSNGHSLPYQVLDWTDPTELFMTGSWWIPGKPANPDTAQPHLCEMNSHEFEIWDGYVASGNYHAGVWLFDVGSVARTEEPATLGYYLPDQVPQQHGGTLNAPFVWSPDVWGAYFDERGYIITADWWSGLYVLKFDATMDDMAEPMMEAEGDTRLASHTHAGHHH